MRYLGEVIGQVRNPHLVLVFRDVAANVKGLEPWHDCETLQASRTVLDSQVNNLSFVQAQELPTLLISYEKAVRYRRRFVMDMAAHLNVPLPGGDKLKDIIGFLQLGAYKQPERQYRRAKNTQEKP